LDFRPVAPGRGGTPVALRACTRCVFVVHECAHRLLHGCVVGWTEWLEQDGAGPFQPYRSWHGQVLTSQPQDCGLDRSGPDASRQAKILHTKSQGSRPCERMAREMGETADTQGCSHEPEVLNDGALLDCRKLIN